MVVGMCALVRVPHCVAPALLELLMMAIEHGIYRFRVRVKNHTRAMQRSPYCVAKRNRCNINAESIYIGLPVTPTTSATLQIIKPMIVSVVVINTSFPLFLLLGERRPQDSCLCLASAFSQMGPFPHASPRGLHRFCSPDRSALTQPYPQSHFYSRALAGFCACSVQTVCPE